jgi:hypothetical protein
MTARCDVESAENKRFYLNYTFHINGLYFKLSFFVYIFNCLVKLFRKPKHVASNKN